MYDYDTIMKQGELIKHDSELNAQKMNIYMGFMKNPDTESWHDARQKIAQAVGDRVFEKDFARVFDSLTLAVASLELKVVNMERTSGYITASGITLSPLEAKKIHSDAVYDWCLQNGYATSILTEQYKSEQFVMRKESMDISNLMGRFDTMSKGLTFQLLRVGEHQTKVKLRFSDVYFPEELKAYYKLVWQAVDKQIFIDQNIEGNVEKRND